MCNMDAREPHPSWPSRSPDPQHVFVQNLMEEAKRIQNDHPCEALDMYSACIQKAEEHSFPASTIATIYSKQAEIAVILNDIGRAIGFANKSIERDPNFLMGYIMKARAIGQGGKYNDATQQLMICYDKGSATDKGLVVQEIVKMSTAIISIKEHIDRAKIRRNIFKGRPRIRIELTGEIETIKESAKVVLKDDPNAASAMYSACIASDEICEHPLTEKNRAILHSNRSLCYIRLKKLEQALTDAERSIVLDPSYGKGYYRKASVLKQLDRHGEVVRTFLHCYDKTDEKVAAADQITPILHLLTNGELNDLGDVIKPLKDSSLLKKRLLGLLKPTREKAKQQMQTNVAGAEHLYSLCITIHEICYGGSNSQNGDLAILYSNRSQCFIKLNTPEHALKDARRGIELDPSYAKAYIRLKTATVMSNKQMSIVKQTAELEQAKQTFIKGIRSLTKSSPTYQDDQMELIIATLELQMSLEDSDTSVCSDIRVKKGIWQNVMETCANKKKYKEMYFVLRADDSGRIDSLTGTAKGIDINPITKNLRAEPFVTTLLLQLIKRGSDAKNLSLTEGDTPVYCALELTLETGQVDLLQHILDNQHSDASIPIPKDQFGDTLYHVVAKSKSKHVGKCLDVLLKKKITPCEPNSKGKLPSSVATDANKSLVEETEKSWSDAQSRKSTKPEQGVSPLQNKPKGESKQTLEDISRNLQKDPKRQQNIEAFCAKIGKLYHNNAAKTWTGVISYVVRNKLWMTLFILLTAAGGKLPELEKIPWSDCGICDVSIVSLIKQLEDQPEELRNMRNNFLHVLLKHKAKPEGLFSEDESPLALSIRKEYIDIARLLLQYNAPADGKHTDVTPPLTLLTSKEGFDFDLALLLLKHGANTNTWSGSEEKRYEAALTYGFSTKDKTFRHLKVMLADSKKQRVINGLIQKASQQTDDVFVACALKLLLDPKICKNPLVTNLVDIFTSNPSRYHNAVFDEVRNIWIDSKIEDIRLEKMRELQSSISDKGVEKEDSGRKDDMIQEEKEDGQNYCVNIDHAKSWEELQEPGRFQWELRLDSKALTTIQGTQISVQDKKAVIKRFKMLMNDEMNDTKDVGDGVKRTKANDTIRILWQFAVKKPSAKFILVWNVVLDHDKLNRAIKRIKETKDLHRSTEIVDIQDQEESDDENKFVPEDTNLKLFNFDATLAYNMICGKPEEVEYPFDVTDTEDSIIQAHLEAPSTILLLGRSGTGKTTCCLFRLWRTFMKYWEKTTNENEGQEYLQRPQCLPLSTEESQPSMTHVEDIRPQDHLHQIFVTKNPKLCDEIERYFARMSYAHDNGFAHAHNEVMKLKDQPNNFQAVHQAAYPLFLTMTEFILLLDGSFANPFFRRKVDGSLQKDLKEWKRGDVGTPGQDDEDDREVTYEKFLDVFWNKVKKQSSQYKDAKAKFKFEPVLVWNEIISCIKGSVESLDTKEGYLSLDEYRKVGRKMAPNFSGDDRDEVYKIFEAYRDEKKRSRWFDSADVVFNLYKKMRHSPTINEWTIHHVYVDEVQDFTQAELTLLIHVCSNPKMLFFTGDTAQTIMRGISFRFKDVTSIFFKHADFQRNKDSAMVPREIYQLTHSYRSHSGILNLASSVVDLLYEFFPESLDKLKPDQGMMKGELPVLIESTSMQLLGLTTARAEGIEFGAKQVIIVVDDKAKDKLVEQYQKQGGLVPNILTIYNAKGLEFDDVFLFDFFTDSLAQGKWELINDRLTEKIRAQRQPTPDHEPQKKVHTYDIRTGGEHTAGKAHRTKPMKVFDFDEHKMLCSELKRLYTAITRARHRLLIFDRNQEKRRHMYTYFEKLQLVTTAETVDGHLKTFTRQSSQTEWKILADDFYERKMWYDAANAYTNAGQVELANKAMGLHQQQLAAKEISPLRKQLYLGTAAISFLRAGDNESLREAAKCFHDSKQVTFCAQLNDILGQVGEAAKMYEKTGRIKDAIRCYESVENYEKTVKLLVDQKEFVKAMEIVKQVAAQPVSQRGNDFKFPSKLYTVTTLARMAANNLCNDGKDDEMMKILTAELPLKERVGFLKHRGKYDLAVKTLEEAGEILEAATVLKSQNKWEEVINLLRIHKQENQQNAVLLAECRINIVRKMLDNSGQSKPEVEVGAKANARARNEIEKHLRIVCKKLYNKTNSRYTSSVYADYAEAFLLFGILKEDKDSLFEARKLFRDTGDIVARAYAYYSLLTMGPRRRDNPKEIAELMLDVAAILEGNLLQAQNKLVQRCVSCDSTKVWYGNFVKKVLTTGMDAFIKGGVKDLPSNPSSGNVIKYIRGIIPFMQMGSAISECLEITDSKKKGYYEEPQASQFESLRWKYCSMFYEVLFSASHHLPALGRSEVTKLFPLIRYTKRISSELIAYAITCCKASAHDSEVDTTMQFLKLWNICFLAYGKSSYRQFGDVLSQYEEEDKGEDTDRVQPGLVSYGSDQGKVYRVRLLTGSLRCLHDKGQVEVAIKCMRSFIDTTRNDLPMPGITSLLEVWLTVSLAISARIDLKPVVLPAGYLAQLDFLDVLYSLSKTGVFEAMQQLTTNPSNLNDVLHVLIGGDRTSALQLALSNEKSLRSGEAERCLIVALVGLCNVQPSDANTHFQSLVRICDRIHLPDDSKLIDVLRRIRDARSVDQVLQILQQLLDERRDTLKAYTWESQRFYGKEFSEEQIINTVFDASVEGSQESPISQPNSSVETMAPSLPEEVWKVVDQQKAECQQGEVNEQEKNVLEGNVNVNEDQEATGQGQQTDQTSSTLGSVESFVTQFLPPLVFTGNSCEICRQRLREDSDIGNISPMSPFTPDASQAQSPPLYLQSKQEHEESTSHKAAFKHYTDYKLYLRDVFRLICEIGDMKQSLHDECSREDRDIPKETRLMVNETYQEMLDINATAVHKMMSDTLIEGSFLQDQRSNFRSLVADCQKALTETRDAVDNMVRSRDISQGNESSWVVFDDSDMQLTHRLSYDDRSTILGEGERNWLDDKIINTATAIIKKQYQARGLQNCVLGSTPVNFGEMQGEWAQIINTDRHDGLHWVLLSSYGADNESTSSQPAVVFLYDSMCTGIVPENAKEAVSYILFQRQSANVQIVPVQCNRQVNGDDCGVHAIANLVAILNGTDPSGETYGAMQMRRHLVKCLEDEHFTRFSAGVETSGEL